MKPLKGMVYVAGPMTLGVREENIANAMMAGVELMNAGWAAFLPQLSYFWDDQMPQAWEKWLAYDLAIIQRCIAIVRLRGESKGADVEEAFANTQNIPVFFSVDSFVKWVSLAGI
jgi:uncharacterized protein DUF4406